jgi:hypothetical protein
MRPSKWLLREHYPQMLKELPHWLRYPTLVQKLTPAHQACQTAQKSVSVLTDLGKFVLTDVVSLGGKRVHYATALDLAYF